MQDDLSPGTTGEGLSLTTRFEIENGLGNDDDGQDKLCVFICSKLAASQQGVIGSLPILRS